MKSALLDAFPRADGKAMRQTALMTFLLVLAAHAFCFLNLTFSGASVMFNAAKGADAQIASGVYLQPFYWRVRGAVSVPILVGLLSAAALSLTGALLSAMLGIKRLPLCAMLAGALALSPAVLVAFAGSVHTADALFLAMLLAACAAALCLRIRVGFMPASLLLAAGQALDPAAFAFFAGVVLIALIQALSDSGESGRLCALRALGGLLCGLLGFGRKWKFYRPLILLRTAAALFYLLLTGMPVSVSRAGIVLLVALVGDFFLLPPDLLTSTSFAAILLGLQNAYAPCDLGFQLSFCAVLGVQAAAALACTEQRAAQDKPAVVKALCQVAEPVQTAVLASLATLPVLVAHGMAASLVGVLCNLLVVWMVQPALQLGILLLVCSAVPFLAAITNLTALVLSLWLKGLLWLVRCCAALPFASICLPQRYTLFALAVLGALAVCFWHARRLRLYLPAAALCTVLAVGLGVWMQRDVVQINLVGASNNPCVVCVQNGQAVVLFRGGESNWSAVQNYLAGRSRQKPALVVDLRAKPTQMEFSAAEIVTVQELADFTTRPVLDGLTLDLYHNKSANLAVLGVGERHIAVGAGRLELAEPVRVDVLCAPGTLSDSVRPDAILYTAAAPRWLDDAAGCTLRYGEDTPGLTLRPGRSMIWEEAQTIAVQ